MNTETILAATGTPRKYICTICYCDESNTLKCADKSCTSRICEDCFVTYLEHCTAEKSLVKCLNEYCKSYIISSSFSKGTSSSYYTLYKKTLVTAFMNSQGPEVKDNMMITKMKETLRTEKKRFVKQFPKAIEFVIEVALNKKLNLITKQNKTHLTGLVTMSNRLCMTSHCNGKLDPNFVCIKCSTKFCKECEKIIKDQNHKCNQVDIESLKFISNMMKCPKCFIPIEKSMGCNGMTCASCKTVFDYSNGTLSDHGSSNQAINPLKTKFKFDFKQNYEYGIGRKLFNIESKEPKEPSMIALNNVIKKLIEQQEQKTHQEQEEIQKEDIAEDVIKAFEKYIKTKLAYVKFISITIDITEKHQKKLLTEEYLDDIYKELTN